MAGKLEFKEKLRGMLEFATEQNLKVSTKDVEEYFEEDALSVEQMDLVCEYLLSQNVAVKGYAKQSGTIKEAKEEAIALSFEEQEYLTEYQRDMERMNARTGEEARMKHYLPKVVDAALLIPRGDLFLGDVIQEGNITLMLSLREQVDAKAIDEIELMDSVRMGMQAFIKSQTEAKVRDRKMVEKVAELDRAIQKLKEDLGREASVEEVAEYLSMNEDEVEEVLKLAGE